MTKKTRLIILLTCVVCFLVVAPILVAYSIGYRFDFEKMKITAIGGIYVNTTPKAERVTIDSKIIKKPGILSNEISFLNLLPKDHTVLIQKEDYFDYFKTLPVVEKQVTILENVILFKKNIRFEIIQDKTFQSPFEVNEKYIIKTNNLYYSSAPENSALTATQKSTPLIKKIVTFTIQNNNIVWLGTDGLLYKSDLADLSTVPLKLTLTPVKITKTGVYKIISDSKDIFVNNNGSLLTLNSKTSELDSLYSPVTDAKISQDEKNIIYYTNSSIYVSKFPLVAQERGLLYKSPEKISNCIWLNNHYIIFTTGNNITISEIDFRGNVNSVTLPQTITVSNGALTPKIITLKTPQIFFNQQEGKLYILTGETILVSEKITQ